MNNLNLSPVLIFTYNRPEHTKNLLDSLSKNSIFIESPLYIFCDHAKYTNQLQNTSEVQKIVNSYYHPKKTIILQKRNLGLARSIINGVSYIFEKYDKAIILEDDLFVSSNFLKYMNESLIFYKKNPKIGSISGFGLDIPSLSSHDNYFHPRPSSWGWGTWRDRWNQAIWDIPLDFISDKSFRNSFNKNGEDLFRMLKAYMNGNISSWAIRWAFTHHQKNWLCSYPYLSKVKNEGFGKDATNCKKKNIYPSRFDYSQNSYFSLNKEIKIEKLPLKNFNYYYSNSYKIKNKLLSLIWR